MVRFSERIRTVESKISFKAFIEFLEVKIQEEKSIRGQFYRFVLDKIVQVPQLVGGISAQEVQQYDEILELVSCMVLPLVENENETMLALVNGLGSEAFYATEAFARLYERTDSLELNPFIDDAEASRKMQLQVQYDFILQKFYGRNLPDKREIVKTFFDEQTRLYKYYRVNIDSRFLRINLKAGRQMTDVAAIAAGLECTESFEAVEKMLPLDDFEATGFCIVTLTDVTEQQAIDQLSKIVLNRYSEDLEREFTYISRLLQTIVGTNEYKFGIMPRLTVNNRVALLYESFPYSILMKASAVAGIHKQVFSRYIRHYLNNPIQINYTAGGNSPLSIKLQQALHKAGVQFYRLVPMFFNGNLVGILEIASAKDIRACGDAQFGHLESAMPYIAHLLKQGVDKFSNALDKIVKDRFTVIQPSVQWKFYEAAWHYLRSHEIEHQNTPIEKIVFRDVYPLYGAIDVRNSTVERNKALREDLDCHLNLLITLLQKIPIQLHQQQAAAFIAMARDWVKKMEVFVSVEDELLVNDFIYEEVEALLHLQISPDADWQMALGDYYKAVDETTGVAYLRRRQLENAMQLINNITGKYLDLFKEELQTCFPSYFEKFRTDGIEYDIYIGQSLAPAMPFTMEHLYRLRFMQLQSMAAITKLTALLMPELEYPIQTTQLIFVNTRSIDISFRHDEKRFDVEGAYNIRYQVIKKRIDKVYIKGSDERLTKSGKIAIVYFNHADAIEWAGYISRLQEAKVLHNDLEYLELQELQGVQGLKALRVGVAK